MRVEVREVTRPVLVKIPVDSAAIKALVVCPGGGKPQLIQLNGADSLKVNRLLVKGSKGRAALNVQLIGNAFSAKANCDSLSTVIEAKDKLISYYRSIASKQQTVKPVAYVPGFVKFLATVGAFTLLLLLLYIIYRIYKRFKPLPF